MQENQRRVSMALHRPVFGGNLNIVEIRSLVGGHRTAQIEPMHDLIHDVRASVYSILTAGDPTQLTTCHDPLQLPVRRASPLSAQPTSDPYDIHLPRFMEASSAPVSVSTAHPLYV